jgi:DNA primase
VEGQMDAISAHQAGFKNVVASSGTALSSDQIKMLKRYTSNILFSFDIDAAGQIAAERGIEQALGQEMNIKVIQVPGGKDPDECIRNNPEDFKQAIERAQSVIDYYFDKTFQGLDLNKIEDKKKAAAKLLAMVNIIASGIEKDMWLKRLAETLEVGEQALREALAKTKTKRVEKTSSSASGAQIKQELSVSHLQLLTESLLALVLKFPEHLSYLINNIKPEMLAEELSRAFYKNLVVYYNKEGGGANSFNIENFNGWLENNTENERELIDLKDLTNTLLLLADRDFYEIDALEAKAEIGKIISRLKRKHLIKKMLVIERELASAEQSKNETLVGELVSKFKIIADEIRRLEE